MTFSNLGVRSPTTASGNRKWLNAGLLVVLAVVLVNQQSFSSSMLFELAEDERNMVPESKFNDEKKLVVAEIASLEAKLADLRATPSQNGAKNDCLLHANNVRGYSIYSQNDEDGALLQILTCMGGLLRSSRST
jgi:hypothetical protein